MVPEAPPARKKCRTTSWPAPISAKVPYRSWFRLMRRAFCLAERMTRSESMANLFSVLGLFQQMYEMNRAYLWFMQEILHFSAQVPRKACPSLAVTVKFVRVKTRGSGCEVPCW